MIIADFKEVVLLPERNWLKALIKKTDLHFL